MAHWFGLKPWDLERLEVDELGEFMRALMQIKAEHAKAT